jgi:ubiquitin-protein ligase
MSESTTIAKTTTLTKATITRLLHDVKNIIKNPLTENGIYYVHDDEDMLKGYALIIGPSDTPYFGGNYFFEINYPTNYPHSPPHVIYCTNGDNIRFNPNLYTNGKVCVSILNTWRGEQWTSCQTISTLLLTLCTLLCKDPLLNEPGVTKTHNDFTTYTKIIEYKNIDIAILKMVNKTTGVYPERFDFFYQIIKEHFIKNAEIIIKYLDGKNANNANDIHLSTSMYNMNVVLNYNKLLKQFKETLENIKK